jgi:electron transport complex protein RnfG
MQKLIRESWLVLTLAVVFAALLAVAQTTLSAAIVENQQKALQDAIGEVVASAAKVEAVEVSGYDRTVFACYDQNGQRSGWAIDAVGVGFADKIRLVIGLSAEATTITGVKVIENVETPGLGNKIAEEEWAGQFAGLTAEGAIVVRKNQADRDKREVQAITGATISSVAVADIVAAAIEKVRPQLAEMAAK